MKFTLSWLKVHLNTTASLQEITDKLTAIGLEVEGVEDASEKLKAFTVAKILEATRHPEADKLQVCKVQSNNGELQIVCGAPNARAGLYVALAQEGAFIPGANFTIKKTRIRGVESNGMLCSFEELGIPGDSAGIIELPEAPIGSAVADALGLNDPVIDIAITPNRADCLGVRGVARDLAAAGLGTLNPMMLGQSAIDKKPFGPSPINVNITTPDCPLFIGCYIKGVKNGQSPVWLKQRVESIGQKSISTLVDITNLFTIGLGRPLHVFDADKLNGNITARAAKEGEKITALNGKEYALPAGAVVIADDAKAVGIAGIIGGAETGCQADTVNIFLETALFTPASIARTGRALQIDSDARYRFERGVDVAYAQEAAKLAVASIIELCGGEASELVIAGKTPEWKREIHFNYERIKSLSGVDISKAECERILAGLGFTGSDKLTPPSWRADVEGEADVIEEIIRINGYDKIPTTPLPKLTSISQAALNLPQKRIQLAKRTLAGRGFLELHTWSFLPKAQAKIFGGRQEELSLLNPISADLDTMRPSLLPNLLTAAKNNAARGFKNTAFFEVGLQFADISPEGQKTVAGGLRIGELTEQNYKNDLFTQTTRAVDAMDVKSDAFALLESLGLAKCEITKSAPGYYHPGRSGALVLGKNVLGYFGEIHPAILAQFDIEGRAAGFEIFLDALPVPRAKGKAKSALKISDYQAVERDFAFIVDASVSAADIIKTINAAEKTLITDVAIFDVYSGKGVDSGKKSVAVKVTLQSFERTLAEADISSVSNNIITAAVKGFGGQLRQ